MPKNMLPSTGLLGFFRDDTDQPDGYQPSDRIHAAID